MTLLWVEAIVLLLSVAVAFWGYVSGRSVAGHAVRALRSLSSRPTTSLLAVAFASLALRAAILPWVGIPEPQVHDEFSHLLAADTFSHFRLANPTHPLWVHFESMHINHSPTYMSMYPPGQGLMMAVGQILFGHPWWGVWMCGALMSASLVWMLRGWMPPFWALIGGLLAILRINLFSYWGNGYWGGALAATAGSLALGAFPRIVRHRRRRDLLVMGSGLAILLLTRPFEGLVFAMAVTTLLASHLRAGHSSPSFKSKSTALLLFLAPLAITGIFQLYFSWKVYGSPWIPPYAINRAQYAMAGVFLWETPAGEPHYNHVSLRNFYVGWELYHFQLARDFSGFVELFVRRLLHSWIFFVGPLLTPLLVAGVHAAAGRRIRPLLWVGLAVGIGLLTEAWFTAHYAAAATAIIYAIMMQGARHLVRFRSARNGLGRSCLFALTIGILFMLIVRLCATPLNVNVSSGEASWGSQDSPGVHRDEIVRRLTSLGGTHLVIVSYAENHHPFQEWVYNAADIDRSPVVWARDMGEDKNAELHRYFPDRRIWLFEPDVSKRVLRPYSVP